MRLASLSSFAAFVVFFALSLLVPSRASASTYVTWIAQDPVAPTSSDVVHVWANSDTAFGESVGVETQIAGTYTKILGTYDTSFTGANWRIDIPAEPAGTTVSYQLFVRNESGTDYDFTGFLWTYTVTDVDAGVDASVDATDAGAPDTTIDDTTVVDTAIVDSTSDVVSPADTFESGHPPDDVVTPPPDTASTDTGTDTAVVDSSTPDSSVDTAPHDAIADAVGDTKKPDSSTGFDATVVDSGSNGATDDSSSGCGCEIPGNENHREFPAISTLAGLALVAARRFRRASASR